MNIVETLLVFVGIPLALALILAALVFGRSAVQHNRYRPGRPWNYAPVWYLPHVDAVAAQHAQAAPPSTPQRAALTAGARPASLPPARPPVADQNEPAAPGTYGGATGEW